MIRRRNVSPKYLPSALSAGGIILATLPASNDVGIRTAVAVTALGNLALNGATLTSLSTFLYLPMPTQIGFTTGIAATTFTAVVTGLDYQDNIRTATVVKSATGVTLQLDLSGVIWKAITSIKVTACSNLADTLKVGWYFRSGTGSQSAVKLPCHVLLDSAADVAHVSLVDAGGGTFANPRQFAAGAAGTTALSFGQALQDGPSLTLSNPDCSAQPTRPVTWAITLAYQATKKSY